MTNHHPEAFLPATDASLFRCTIEILHYIHSLHCTNSIAKQLDTNFALEAGILHQAIQHLLEGKPFSENQLNLYFHLQQSLEEFHRTLQDSEQASLEAHLPYQVDFLLLGFSAKAYSNLTVTERTNLHQQYEILFWELLESYLTVNEFITSTQKLLKTYNP